MDYSKKKLAKFFGLPLAILAVSTAAILIRLSNSHPITIAFFRMFFSSLLFLPLFLRRKKELKKINFRLIIFIVLSGFSLGLHFASWIYSLQFTTVASSVVLVSSHPLLVLFLSDKLLGESVNKKAYYSVLLALIGVSLIVLGDLRVEEWNMIGDFLALGGMIFLAIYLIIGRKVRKDLSTVTYVFLVYCLASFLLGFISFTFEIGFVVYSIREYVIFFSLALIPTLLGHSVYNWALRYLKPDLVSISLLGEPILSSILAAIIFIEFPPSLSLLGFLITIYGIYISLKWR